MDENLTEAVNALKRAYQLAVEHKGTLVCMADQLISAVAFVTEVYDNLIKAKKQVRYCLIYPSR
jgi:hypothetical protein